MDVEGRLTGGSGFATVDVADNDHVNVHLFFTVIDTFVSMRAR